MCSFGPQHLFMYLLLFTSLEAFVRAPTALPGNHSVLFTSLQLVLPMIDAIPAFVYNLFSEISENSLFPKYGIKPVAVVFNFFNLLVFSLKRNKQYSRTVYLCLVHVALSEYFKFSFSCSCYSLRSNYYLTSLGVTGET